MEEPFPGVGTILRCCQRRCSRCRFHVDSSAPSNRPALPARYRLSAEFFTDYRLFYSVGC
ncbi:hypothetical protein HSRCO_0069 [Halanaeroarchaeum sp. HSR-CO]|nr:hypothetical protein HSRCO_0069 [Halanaeroarchaeum sp. HSR-CO]